MIALIPLDAVALAALAEAPERYADAQRISLGGDAELPDLALGVGTVSGYLAGGRRTLETTP